MRQTSLLLYTFLFLISATSSCERSEVIRECPPTLSPCASELIAQGETQEGDFPIVQVWEWHVDGDTYYYTVADCCDMFNHLYDADCEFICSPDGGLSGQGTGDCPEFKGEVQWTLLWEQEE